MIDLKKGENYYGFLLKNSTDIPDIHSTGYLFQHLKSGAQLYYVKNSDNNKVFFISFKTPPEDNCGTPHILEHSVLCGSRKYHAKDPFNELAKGSLNTYLNALTYADKTMYPVASRNEKDLMNMMDVYLDAVFYPRIYQKQEIFMQEGWHYELTEKEKNIDIKGVVYNEMKGALSDPESILGNCISSSLFPESIYRFESGGDPDFIPNLSYETFLDFHKKYYHPSNSYIYLYGDMEIEPYLKYLDESYLSSFDKEDISSEIALSKEMSEPVTMHETYPVPAEQKIESETYLAYNVKVGTCTDPQLIMSFNILNYILLETNASPLKKALIASGITVDAEGWFDSSTLEMVYSIIGKKSEKNQLSRFCSIIEDTLQDIVQHGLNQNLVESALNRWEFSLREEDFGHRPKGLTYGMKLMKNWLHEQNPDSALMIWKHFEAIKNAQNDRYFEKLIQNNILQNKNKSFVTVAPVAGKQISLDKIFHEKMQAKKASLSPDELNALWEKTKALEQYQIEPETEEVLKQIPTLSIDEIDKKADTLHCREIIENDVKILFTPLDTNGIAYIQLLFNTRSVPQHYLPYVGLLTRILGKLDTAVYSFDQLPVEIDFYTGGVNVSCDIFSIDKEHHQSFVAIAGRVLIKNMDRLFHIFEDILFNTDFSKKENLKKLIRRSKVRLENYLLNNSHLAAKQHSCSNISQGARIKEEVSGITFYHFLSELEKDLDNQIDNITDMLIKTSEYLFKKGNFVAALACEEKDYVNGQHLIENLQKKLDSKDLESQEYQFILSPAQKAFTSSSKVQYNVKSANYLDFIPKFTGKMHVLKTIIDLEYLWNRVRIQGGAYGCGCQFLRDGCIFFYSYRDPNLIDTITAYNETENFIRNFHCTQRELTRFILGTLNSIDRPKSNAEKSDLVLNRYFRHISPEQLQEERNEILSITETEIKSFADLFHFIVGEENICTIGNENYIQNNMGLFETIQALLN